MTQMRVALAQLNPVVGDLDGNVEKIIRAAREAADAQCDLVAFPELMITGYPPEDLVLKPSFVDDNLSALQQVASSLGELSAVVGFVDRDSQGIYNAAALISKGAVAGVYRKDRKSTRLNSSHVVTSRMPSSA